MEPTKTLRLHIAAILIALGALPGLPPAFRACGQRRRAAAGHEHA